MASNENSNLKRGRQSQGEVTESKRIRSDREQSPGGTDDDQPIQLPSPLTHQESTATNEDLNDGTVTPPPVTPPHQSQIPHAGITRTPQGPGFSPPSDTQPFSQFVYPPRSRSYAVEDEEGEGVWGYLVPLDNTTKDVLVLRRRASCPVPGNMVGRTTGKDNVNRGEYRDQEEVYEGEKAENGIPAGGYLIGRHPECDRIISPVTVSNRHCLIFSENKGGDTIAVLEDLSANGTYVNEALVGRNKRRVLKDGDEIAIVDEARFIFRYPLNREANGFRQQYSLGEQLGKGHFASVYLCVERCSGIRYAVKKFEKRTGPGERSKSDGLQQEIAVLMSVSHPALVCLKDTFDEEDGVYLVLELAAEGELFNWIVMKQKLTEEETRKVFVQLFQAVKYLHERNIVHRDIKPENILLTDKDLHVKLADFGLAKIIGEESFTTTLCGTPSYVAPEILETGNHRRYTKAVDVWSLGVVLYICLCGFPPFSDELYSEDNPYTLTDQIREGRFDFPSPYWDSVQDSALDLIDDMLTVDVNERFTIDQCLEHPWITQPQINPNDSTDGLTGQIATLGVSRRVQRERTLLASINDVTIARVIDAGSDQKPIKIYEKNANSKVNKLTNSAPVKEAAPAANRVPDEFIQMGGKGDQVLFETLDGSRYPALDDKEVAAGDIKDLSKK
jgi:serine/threonine-protein kinase Chk2